MRKYTIPLLLTSILFLTACDVHSGIVEPEDYLAPSDQQVVLESQQKA